MLDLSKVKIMTKLAFYEQTEGKEDFKISEYYRKDYTGLHTICSVLWTTVGYGCFWLLIVLAGLESWMSKLSAGLLITLMVAAIVGYFVVVIIFGIITNRIFNKKHKNARQRVKRYNHDLIKLLKMYEKEKN